MKKFFLAMGGLALLLTLAGPASASNGINMIGYGAIASGMGGADMAVPSGCTAIAGNPAQLATTCNRVISVAGSLMQPSMSVTMPGQDSVDNETQLLPLGFLGYAQRVGASRWAWGLGIYAQGGMGVDFKNVKNFQWGWTTASIPMVAFMRLAPTVAYNVTDKLYPGPHRLCGLCHHRLRLLPPTGNPGPARHRPFLLHHRRALRAPATRSTTSGPWAPPTPAKAPWTWTAARWCFNFGPGLGQVNYRDVKMDNFTWPRQAKVGLSFRPASQAGCWPLTLAWVNWASAIQTVTVTASNPSTARCLRGLRHPHRPLHHGLEGLSGSSPWAPSTRSTTPGPCGPATTTAPTRCPTTP